MKLTKTSLITRFYMWTYGRTEKELPNNLCNYFWSLIAATLLLPLTIWSYPFQRFAKFRLRSLGAKIGTFFGSAFLLFILSVFGYGFYMQPGVVIGGILGGAVLLSLLHLQEKKKLEPIHKFSSEVMDIVSTKIEAKKNRYCPKIDWE